MAPLGLDAVPADSEWMGIDLAASHATGPAGALDAPGVGVVIVDDQAPFRSVARTLVGMIRGWQVLGEAESGEDGVELALRVLPQLVLMDINLPGINGIEATRRITRSSPGTAVVLLSTYAAEDLPEDATTCGAAGYIRKDDLTPKLLRTILANGSATT